MASNLALTLTSNILASNLNLHVFFNNFPIGFYNITWGFLAKISDPVSVVYTPAKKVGLHDAKQSKSSDSEIL